MGAYHNALREEGSREDLLRALEKAWDREAKLEEALKPFAAFADRATRIPPSFVITQGSAMARRQLTMADCYAAAEALDRTKP